MQPGKRLLAGAIAMVVCALGAGPALAIPINGDQTVGIITSFDALGSAGIDVSVDGAGAQLIPDSFLGDIALFTVTGGSVDPGSITLLHEGQSLILSNGIVVEFQDLVIELVVGSGDKLSGVMKADATVGGIAQGQQTIFDLTLCQNAVSGGVPCTDADGSQLINGFRMTLNEDFWGSSGIELPPDLAGGDQFGVVLLDVRVVPEPSTLTLAGLGLLGLAIAGRRRRR